MTEPKRDVNTILSHEAKIERYNQTMAIQIQGYTAMSEDMANLEREIAGACMDYYKANPTKEVMRMSSDKLEKIACNETKQLHDKYLLLVYYRSRRKSVEKVMDATHAGLSSIQSVMKFTKI